MRTQISILVKDETIPAKTMTSVLWPVYLLTRSKMKVWIDGQMYKLKASKTPYTFDVQPGTHKVTFKDPREGGKSVYWKTVGMFFSFLFSFTGSNTIGSLQLDMIEANQMCRLSERENCLDCTLQDGDILKLSCRSNIRANVKVKVI